MWTQMGQLFWGARFPGHHQSQMQSSGDPKCFNPFGKMDMGDPTGHLGHPIVNKPGPSIPNANGIQSSKSEAPRNAHSAHGHHGTHHHSGHHHNDGHHNGLHNMSTTSSSSPSTSKHKTVGGHDSNYAHQGGASPSVPAVPNPYSSHAGNNIPPPPPPPFLPSMQPPTPLPPPPPPSSHNSPQKQQQLPSQERLKKCKAVFGQGQKELWCNKCRWKKKCIRFPEVDTENGKDQDAPSKKNKKKIPDPPTQVPPQHFRYQNPSHDLPPIPHQQQQAWYNSVVNTITGCAGLPPELLQHQQQQSRYRNPGSSSENSSPSPSLNSQYHRYSSPSHPNGSHLPPSPGGVPPPFLGHMPPGFGGFDPAKLTKSPVNTLKPSHNKDSHQHGQKPPPFNSDAIFSGEGADEMATAAAGVSLAPPPTGNSTNRKCRALYGFEQKNKWCKPCKNKKRCVQFI